MRAFLFDANAVVRLYHPHAPDDRIKLERIMAEREIGSRAAFFIPEFCIVEVLKVFAKMHYKTRELREDMYRTFLERFREEIHWGSVFYPLALTRYHILAADEIAPLDYESPSKRDKELSAFDILLIAMASELSFAFSGAEVFVVTFDKRIKEVCDLFKNAQARTRRPKGRSGGLDWPKVGRWRAPEVLSVSDVEMSDLEKRFGPLPKATRTQ